nr:tyrosine-type recombinase/integrase [Clostridium sp. BL-8]
MNEQLPQFIIHGLRHTHAAILLLKGENIKVISERLGHKSTQITWDTYSQVLPSMKKQTADLLNNIFNDLYIFLLKNVG